MDDSTHVRETDSRAFKLVGAMESLEDTEQLVDILHIEPYSIITYENDSFARASVGGADCNLGFRSRRCEFHRIGD
jgi:hypothetical protein